MNKYLILSLAGLVLAGCTSAPTQSSVKLSDSQISVVTPTETITNSPTPMAQKITAVIHTSMGDMTVNLYPEKAPNTVANFVGLAKGTKDWTNSQGQKVSGTPLYQNVIFHRVIKDFMIQGGDPEGTGRGGPGYRFDDEPVTDSYLRG
ncbi:MAG: Peptidylprolyl isomerase, partial [Candidatus Collierbacteria bacterium GW2011_GWE1_46_18]